MLSIRLKFIGTEKLRALANLGYPPWKKHSRYQVPVFIYFKGVYRLDVGDKFLTLIIQSNILIKVNLDRCSQSLPGVPNASYSR